MKRTLRQIAWVFLLGVLSLAAVMWAYGPYEPVNPETGFNTARIGDDPAAFLAASEAPYADLLPHARKRIVWASEPGQKTPLSVIFLHGFSASAEELRPLPDDVAAALGANLFYTRFTGHGRSDPDALNEGTADRWLRDAAEALEIGRRIGERVIVLSNSTGGTLAALSLTQPDLRENVAGVAFLSPNFGINNPAAPLLTMPAARQILPKLLGTRRSWTPRTPEQGLYWTTDYPSEAVMPLAAVVKAAREADYTQVQLPALFYFSPLDQVVDATRTEDFLLRWGGPVTVHRITELPPGDDEHHHVLAGRVLSPGNTPDATRAVLDWIKGLQ